MAHPQLSGAREASSLIGLLRARAAADPGRPAFTFLADGEREERLLTYGELDRRARAIAAHLQALPMAGERALLLLPPGLDFISAFAGCLYAGVAAVPVSPPTGRRALPRLQAILADCGPRAILTAAAARRGLEKLLARHAAPSHLPEIFLEVDGVAPGAAEDWRETASRADDVAFLQYTSGSTSSPKGVMVSHGNLLANQRMIQEAFATDEGAVIASWLPPHHDMGLIGGLLHPLFLGARCVLLSPLHFLQRPRRWLEAISRHRASVSGGPNFAYDLCARRVALDADDPLDLSAWRVAFNGAEPVRAEALERFAAAFAGAGFRSRAFFPCYGLAEATLLVSGRRAQGEEPEEPAIFAADAAALSQDRVAAAGDPRAAAGEDPPAAARRLVGCGRVASGLEVRLVDPVSSTERGAEEVGEIWVAGESVALGYWAQPRTSAETFAARLPSHPGTFLRTGDLGFVRDGELFVAGRLKDLILVRGRNLYPQDIEWTAERSHPALRPGGGAAFAVEAGGEERLVLVQEVASQADASPATMAAMAAAIRRAMAEEHEVQVASLLLARPGAVPKTTSGKVRRRACRDLFLSGGLEILGSFEAGQAGEPVGELASRRRPPRTPAEERVAQAWEEVLDLVPGTVGADDDFFVLGGDSLRGAQLLARLQESGAELTLDDLFAAPTVARLAARLEAATAGALETGDATAPIPRADRGRPLPLTSTQRRFWFLDQLEPGNPAYNLGLSLRLPGAVEGIGDNRRSAPAAAAALGEIARRHEALRTVFRVVDGAPVQVVLQPAAGEVFPLPVVDLSGLAVPAAAAAAAESERQLTRRSFALDRAPLLRAALLRRAAADDRLCLAVHHIVADGWSLGVLLVEIVALYKAAAERCPSPLPALPLQLADFAVWQESRQAGPEFEARIAAWRRRLGDTPPPVLDIPADHPRPAVPTYRGAHLARRLPAALAGELRALAAAHGASPFMALLCGVLALLARTAGQRDLVVGTASANRERVELEGLIGCFVNTLALRVDASGDPPFADLLGRVRRTLLAALADRDLPFERLLDRPDLPRDLSRPPLVQVMVVQQSAPRPLPPLSGSSPAAREIDNGTARFDLALSLLGTDEGVEAVWKYSRDLFDAVTIERMAAHLAGLLGGAVRDPGRRLGELPLLTAAERQQIVREWNATEESWPRAARGACLHELFADQAGRTPDAVALVVEQGFLTYGELDRRSDRLARLLRRLGVAPEILVGVAVERSLELLVGLLAVLKAGGAYLPLDPSYPAERLAFMLADARVAVLLTQERLAGRLPAGSARVICLDSPPAREEPAGPPLPPAAPSGENLAYVIYTSGSTGSPKGSMIPHEGIVNRLLWMQREYGLAPGEGVLQKTPVSFDVSVWELFWPLLVGARLVLARPGGHQDSAYLAGLIANQQVSTLHFVPAMLQVFLAEPRLGDCRALRRVMASGEALPPELAARFHAVLGDLGGLPGAGSLGVELHNLYGPTEASVDVTAWPVARASGARGTVPIGRPISNLRIHLLDSQGSPAPAGVPGHLHIAGVGLSRGYLRRPDLTAERFVPDSLGAPGGRLYATGDLARLRTDGAIEFLGRLDHQVKLRGFRIELGEIEAALATHPAVREAVVTAHQDAAGHRLAAYVVPRSPQPGDEPRAADLHLFLAARLPEPMVPAAFVVLPAFPLTPSGKVDRRRLPAPQAAAAGTGRAAPLTAVEARIAAMWSEQLGAAQVGALDSFFALGGDSIQGALFINRLQRDLDAILYVMPLFEAPTVEGFAAHLERSYRRELAQAGWIAPDEGGGALAERAEPAGSGSAAPLASAAAMAELTRHLAARFSPAAAGDEETAAKNPPAIFILAPFRSGSTLLRVMLAGHPRLFAPPELELLGFRTLGERRRALSGRDGFAREGLLRAVMELESCDAQAAGAIVAQAEERDDSVAAFYRELQRRAGERILVDKTPRYCLHPPALRRAESWFLAPRFVHLVRHPAATIHSYLEARLDEVHGLPLPRRQQAELVWQRGHENILDFLAAVPAERQIRVRFEELVAGPREVMEGLCAFLGIDFHPALLSPYEGRRMTDGLHAAGRMMGDPKFHHHQAIEPAAAGRWRTASEPIELAPGTWHLAARLGYPPPAPAPEDALLPSPAEPGFPLSFAQQRLWFLHRLEQRSTVYNMPAAVRLRGRLDAPALARAAAAIERRHEVLRTVFPAAGGRPRQVVVPPRPALLPAVDLGGLAEPARQAEAARLLADEAGRPFDLAAGPLWRMRLVRLSPEDHHLQITLHHIVCDGWSVGVLTRELADLYATFREGRHSPLPELPLQYGDFALGQRRRISGELLAAHLRYWRRQLAEPLPVLALPTDRPRPAVQTYRGAILSLDLPPALATGLRELGRATGSTLFMVLAAGFQALLQAYSGQDDLVIATVSANRDRAEIENLIGVFVNTLVLRTDLSGDPAWRALLGRVRQVCVGAFRHAELPFERLVGELAVDRSLGRPPLDAAMLALQNAPRRDLALSGLAVERLPVPSHIAKSDLSLDWSEHQGGLRAAIEYNVDLFDAATTGRLAGHLLQLFAGAIEDPDRRIGDLPFLGAAERHQIVIEWNATAITASDSERRPAACLHELFEAQAARTPDAVAVSVESDAESGALTYGELQRRADRLALHLRRSGVGPEVLVGVAMERSPEAVVAILAVLKASGAYLPLDPDHPADRLAFMLADARAPVLITQERLRGRLPEGGAVVLSLGADGGVSPREIELPAERSKPFRRDIATAAVLPDNLAYAIYTSGSTGVPKGVQISHRSIVDHLLWAQRRLPVGPTDSVVLKTALSFDASLWELFLPLANGARIELARPRGELDVGYLARLVTRTGATVLQVVPSMLAVFLEDPAMAACTSLRRVLCGSEALSAPLCERFHQRSGAELHNLYGPTECSIDAAHWACEPRPASAGAAVPIGRPIDNAQIHLLDRRFRPVPLGVPGHLHIGGMGVARGYLGRPELTAELFVPDPWGGAGRRLYATGDLARRRADGAIEFLGRLDHQVKVRGFRIELGEIEACLLTHPAVRQAVVVARRESREAAGLRLVAYVVERNGAEIPAAELRSYLAARLPEPMVPRTFVALPALPLGPNEKVDRARLPQPGDDRSAAAYVSPESANELLIAEVWRQVLGVERIGIHDNFFDLGGHSLLAAEVHGKLRERLQIDLPLLDLFQHPTVHALAGRLSAGEPQAPDLSGRIDQAHQESRAIQRRRKALARQRNPSAGPPAVVQELVEPRSRE